VVKLAQTELRIERHCCHTGHRIPDHGGGGAEIRLRPYGHAIAGFNADPREQGNVLERSSSQLCVRPRLVRNEKSGAGIGTRKAGEEIRHSKRDASLPQSCEMRYEAFYDV